MAGQNWDVAKPDDHLKVSLIPQKIRDLKSSVKTIIQKEHVALSTDNIGGQHLKGSARVYMASDAPTVDPEGDSLSADTADTGDDGRIAVATGVGTNTMKVYMATSAGISTGWNAVRVAHAGTSERVRLANNAYIDALHATGAETFVSVIKLNADDVPEVLVGAVLSADTAPAEDVSIANKKYVDAAPKAQAKVDTVAGATFGAASESVTLPNGLVMKTGNETRTGTSTPVSFGDNFPTAILTVIVTGVHTSGLSEAPVVASKSTSGFTIKSGTNAASFDWIAIGY